MSNILSTISNTVWAITPDALEQIVQVNARNFDPVELAKTMHGTDMWKNYVDGSGNINFDALETEDAPILDGARKTRNRNGIAIIPAIGPLFPRANLMTLSGATSVQTLAKDFRVAMESDQIEHIVLYFDTPGGDVTGIDEFAQQIYEARGDKPITAYVAGYAASGGYWLASQADEIIISSTAQVGSIGVVAMYRDETKKNEKAGIEEYEIVSSNAPYKRLDMNTQEGIAKVRARLDKIETVFHESIARGRAIDAETVKKEYGGGDVFVGSDAVDRGMADRTGTLDIIIDNQLTSKTNVPPPKTQGDVMDIETLKTEHPDVYNAIYTQGVKDENARIRSIEEDVPAEHAESIRELKFDTSQTAESVALFVLKEQKKTVENLRQQRDQEAAKLAQETQGVGSTPDDNSESEEDAFVKAAVDAVTK